jgi:TonB-linked SusC/RagA family outer membrane protein
MYNFYPKKLVQLPGCAPNILLIMKLTTLILVAAILQVSASTYAQKITLTEKNTPLNKVFEKISDQTGYDFIVSTENLKKAKPVTINVQNEEVKSVLDKIFAVQPLNFIVREKMVVVSKKDQEPVDRIKNWKDESLKISGRITDTSGTPLKGATIKNLTIDKPYSSDEKGEFTIEGEIGNRIVVTYIGFRPYTFIVSENLPFQDIVLHAESSRLEQVSVVSTGYQTIPKERATGSFVQIDNQLLHRSVSTNILDRLNGITSSLIVQNNGNIEIRGRATLFSNPAPLIVVDNFEYDGDVKNINPNDIENITILKDAAATSAWGSRSGNGVIVITTKRGRLNTEPTVSVTANTTIGDKPNLYYTPQLTSAQYIDVEQFLFSKGAYNSTINNGYGAISPAVSIFSAKKKGNISAADSTAKINNLKGLDVRKQLLEYFYRPSVNQQYQASISGGNVSQKYFISAGYDKNQNNLVNNNYNRVTLNASNTYYLLKNKLEFFSNIIYTGSKVAAPSITPKTTFPYDQIADANGNPLSIANTLNIPYATTAGNGKLLNWLYKPLDELNNGYSTNISNQTDYRVNLSLSYKIIHGVQISAKYNYEKGVTEGNTLNELQSYYTRNLINTFTQIDATGAVIHPLPIGGILNGLNSNFSSNNGRFQINYDNNWGKHAINVIAGAEVNDYTTLTSNYSLYGYDAETATNLNSAINYTAILPYFYGFNTGQITPNSLQSGATNRFISEYFNGSYVYNDKYIASLSARKDESNLFGVAENQKGVPLWSAGLAWVANNESFYRLEWLPHLKLRATYGYTGIVNTSISAYLTAIAFSQAQTYNVPQNQIVNPPNPSLRWEKDQNINIGLDFGIKGNRLNGSIEYWQKNGMDLIGNSPIAPQTGITLYTGNSANTSTKGLDIQLNSVNLNGGLKWLTTILFNYQHSLVTKYLVSNGTNLNVVQNNFNNPLQGYPYYALFTFKYAGLNATGNPQGYFNGQVSTNYSGILNSTNRAELVFRGSSTPTKFGSVRNAFIYKDFDLSFNITYKLGYYFRRSSLNNTTLYTVGGNYQMADYDNRWQKAGDELHTNVPALVYPNNNTRNNLYTFSDALVEKGDHIRLQDLRLGYTMLKKANLPFKNLNFFSYVNNIGILWRANKHHIDPDYSINGSIPIPRTIAFGIKADL